MAPSFLLNQLTKQKEKKIMDTHLLLDPKEREVASEFEGNRTY